MARNLALIGCGAIAQASYLPAMAKYRGDFGRIWLVDPSDHALTAAAAAVTGERAHRLSEVEGQIHLAVIATPNHSHFPLAMEALSRGADVLIEKPFVIWPEDGRRLAEAARAQERVIAINQTRRFFPLAQELRKRIQSGEFGKLKSVVHKEGTKLSWPFESGAGFAPDAERTGAIMDFGVHVIDFYHYLLQPQWKFVSATHDGFTGPEGLADIELRADDVPVSIRLSRYQTQENIARLTFERGEISFGVHDGERYTVRSMSGKVTPVLVPAKYESPGEPLLLNFVAASEKREPVVCDAVASQPVIDVLDDVYRLAERYPMTLGIV